MFSYFAEFFIVFLSFLKRASQESHKCVRTTRNAHVAHVVCLAPKVCLSIECYLPGGSQQHLHNTPVRIADAWESALRFRASPQSQQLGRDRGPSYPAGLHRPEPLQRREAAASLMPCPAAGVFLVAPPTRVLSEPTAGLWPREKQSQLLWKLLMKTDFS